MNTIDVLNEMSLKIREKRDGRKDEKFSFYLDCTGQIKALTEAIESLKCDKLARVRTEARELMKTLLQEAAFIARNSNGLDDEFQTQKWVACAVRLKEGGDRAADLINQLDKEQA
jgi:hypothetical protein